MFICLHRSFRYTCYACLLHSQARSLYLEACSLRSLPRWTLKFIDMCSCWKRIQRMFLEQGNTPLHGLLDDAKLADILIPEQYSPCWAPLTHLLPLLTCIAAPAHPPATTYWLLMRLWLFRTGVCKGEKTVKYTIFTANSRHALTACFWHQIIHNVNAIRWNCYMNMSEAYLLCFS